MIVCYMYMYNVRWRKKLLFYVKPWGKLSINADALDVVLVSKDSLSWRINSLIFLMVLCFQQS